MESDHQKLIAALDRFGGGGTIGSEIVLRTIDVAGYAVIPKVATYEMAAAAYKAFDLRNPVSIEQAMSDAIAAGAVKVPR